MYETHRKLSWRLGRRVCKGRRAARSLAVTAGLCCLLGAGVASSAGEGPSAVGETRTALQEWVETQRTISQEKRDWALRREMLQERIGLMEREIESFRTKISDAQESIAEADKKRGDLVQENESLKEASSSLDDTVLALESRIRALLPQLPDPIRERVKPLSQRLPDDPEIITLSLSERFQNIAGILDEVNKFNGEITVTSEVRVLPDGTSAEVTALYIGIGQGYYTGAGGTVGGVGGPSEGKWVWTPANGAAAAIAETIAMLKNEEMARFVQLPIRIIDEETSP